MTKNAYIFDMDGLLINSEPVWQKVEQQVFGSVGIDMTIEMCEQTTGIRVADVIEYWYERYPWQNKTKAQVYDDIINAMVANLKADLIIKPGAVELITKLGQLDNPKIAICSSSPLVLIETVVAVMGIGKYLKVLHSGENEEHGKPHPMSYIHTAKKLGVSVNDSVVFEDSMVGTIAGKASGAYVVAVPEGEYSEAKFAFCDEVLGSLADYKI